jgi:ubiquinone/menaquinone biosynthesis C-methylase UbiE
LERSHWEVTRQLIELANVNSHDNVMELGCGFGWVTRVLAEKASAGVALGVDLSDRMVHEARTGYRNPANALFLVADAARLPCRSGFFHSVLSVDSIFYYPNMEGAINEVSRVLAPGGKAHFLISYYKENVYSHEWAKYIDIPVHLLDAETYKSLLQRAGFRTVTHRRVIDSAPLPMDWNPTRWFPTRQDQEQFHAEGALLVVGEK